MKLKQYYLGCLAHASYLIGDDRTKTAAVVDPQRDVEQYLEDATAKGWTIKHVFLTHFHADFLAGHIELRNRVGARIYLGSRAEAEYDFLPLKEGDVVEFGDVRIKALETPGHTPESVSLLVFDLAKSDVDPYAVLTGDALFIGDVGRPDLLASIGVSADDLANMLYDSVGKLKALPDETLVYPAHGAGSLCGKNLSDETVSTIGEQKKFNYALQPMSREKFVAMVEVDQPDAPDYFVFDAIRNRQERPDLGEAMKRSVHPLALDAVVRLRNEGAQLVDVRDGIDFEGAHLKGSLNIGLRGKYATWAGALLNREQPIVVIAEPGEEEEAIMRLGRIGFDNVSGYLDGGMRALESTPYLVGKTERITAQALARSAEEGVPFVILDVRTEREREISGFLDGSRTIPLSRLEERIAEVPATGPLVVHCEGGYRSAIACSLLKLHGLEPTDLVGGFRAWEASGLQVARPEAAAS